MRSLDAALVVLVLGVAAATQKSPAEAARRRDERTRRRHLAEIEALTSAANAAASKRIRDAAKPPPPERVRKAPARRHTRAELRALGLDARRRRKSKEVQAVKGSDGLSLFMPDGRIDSRAADKVVSQLEEYEAERDKGILENEEQVQFFKESPGWLRSSRIDRSTHRPGPGLDFADEG